jgi:hypothetical protein
MSFIIPELLQEAIVARPNSLLSTFVLVHQKNLCGEFAAI